MDKHKSEWPLKIATALAFAAMVALNYLAQGLPLNGRTPAEVSDSMPTLFAPAGFTFSIWGIIYLALAGFAVYQFGLGESSVRPAVMTRVRGLFILSSLANMAWLLSWHYDYIGISVIWMLMLLTCLVVINLMLDEEELSQTDRWLLRLPFSLYFGWITVATVANVAAFLLRIGWNRFGLSEEAWMLIILLVVVLIGASTIIKRRDIAYGLVLIWAFAGILAKHVSPTAFATTYTAVVAAVIAGLVVFVNAVIYLIVLIRRNQA